MSITPEERQAFIEYAKTGAFNLDWFTHEKILNALEPGSPEAKRYIGWLEENLGGLPGFNTPLPVSVGAVNALQNGDASRQAILETVIDTAAPVWKKAVESIQRDRRAEVLAKKDSKKLLSHALEHGVLLNAFEIEEIFNQLGEMGSDRLVVALQQVADKQMQLTKKNADMYDLGHSIELNRTNVADLKGILGDEFFGKMLNGVVAAQDRIAAAQEILSARQSSVAVSPRHQYRGETTIQ